MGSLCQNTLNITSSDIYKSSIRHHFISKQSTPMITTKVPVKSKSADVDTKIDQVFCEQTPQFEEIKTDFQEDGNITQIQKKNNQPAKMSEEFKTESIATTTTQQESSQATKKKVKAFFSKDFKGLKKIGDIKDNYLIGCQLGKGNYGTVRITKHKQLHIERAVKIVRKKFLSKSIITEDLMQNEIKAQEELSHPNMIKINEILENDKSFYVVQELCKDGTLQDLINKNKLNQSNLSEEQVKIIAKQMFSFLKYLHRKRYMHRDIKPDNIMIEKESLEIKMADFGFSINFKKDDLQSTVIGTPYYMAPEITLSHPYTEKVDIWSSGIVIFELISSENAFSGLNSFQLFDNIQNQEIDFNSNNWQNISSDAKDFISKCLSKSPCKRWNAEQLLAHPWLNSNIELEQIENQTSITKMKSMLGHFKDFSEASTFQKAILTLMTGMLAEDQDLQRVKDKFKIVDKNGQGFISSEDLNLILNQTQISPNDVQFQKISDMLDQFSTKNRAYKIEMDDFSTCAIAHKNLIQADNLEKVFNMIDHDQAGSITSSKFENIFCNKVYTKKSKAIKSIFEEMQENGMITKERFMESMLSFLGTIQPKLPQQNVPQEQMQIISKEVITNVTTIAKKKSSNQVR